MIGRGGGSEGGQKGLRQGRKGSEGELRKGSKNWN